MAPLRLQYSITAEDLAEAQRRWTIHPGVGGLACAAMGFLLLLPQALHPDIPLRHTQPVKQMSPLDLLILVAQWGLILVVIWLVTFQFLRRIGKQPWEIPPQRRAAPSSVSFWASLVVSWVVIVGSIAWTIISKRHAAAALGGEVDPDYSPAFETILTSFPILVVSVVLPLFLRRTNTATRRWSRQYHLHRPFITDIDEAGLRVSEPLMTVSYDWRYFRGHTQSPNLLLLYPTALQVVMIPKRAFPTPEARQEFTDFLARTIVAPAKAFPVLPALPLPALPVAVASTTTSTEAVVTEQGF
jgi:YcxB-like protein